MKGIVDNVRASVTRAGMVGRPMRAFPFPGRRTHTANYVRELADYLSELDDDGILWRQEAR